MKTRLLTALFVVFSLINCAHAQDAEPPPMSLETEGLVAIHVFVALCDNENQGIVPVSPRLGDGNDPFNNLYWGARYGMKTFFKNAGEWRMITTIKNYEESVLERALFRHSAGKAYIVADAYRGRDIKKAIEEFMLSAAGGRRQRMNIELDHGEMEFRTGGLSDIVVYVGHNGLMDFTIDKYPGNLDGKARESIVLGCFSRDYFTDPLKKAGSPPLLLTTGLMAPEAYILKSVLDGRLLDENREQLRDRAARTYDRYQNTGFEPAQFLFVSPPPDDFLPEPLRGQADTGDDEEEEETEEEE